MEISNPDKLMFPTEGLTKEHVVGHYDRIGDLMLAHVVNRPLTLHRFPNGVAANGFMQKNASDHFPKSIGRFEMTKREGGSTRYPYVTDKEGLVYLANQATIAFHIPTGSVPSPHRPDRVVFDLDPPQGGWRLAAEAAHAVGALLAELGLPSAPMTTGSNGFHVVAPVTSGPHIDAVGAWAQLVAAILATRFPGLLTDEFRIPRREGRVFVDWLRNRYAQNGIAPWSLRARPGAPAATPVTWDDIDHTPPDTWTLEAIAAGPVPPDTIAALDARPGLETAMTATDDLARSAGVETIPFDRFR